MPSKSRSQARFFWWLKGNPAERKKRGLTTTQVSEFTDTPQKNLPEKVRKPNK